MNKKVCRHGLNDIWINENTGSVRMCGWSNYFIGNLVDNSIEEIWNGDLAQKFRESMLDGSYRFCNPSKCPYCANEKLEEIMTDYIVPDYPEYCSLSYQLQCNYKCKFCREDYYKPCDCERDNYNKIEKEVDKILPHLKTLSSNGAGEFFCSDSILKVLSNANLKDKIKIIIESNGSMFNRENWKKIERLGKHNLSVAITVHSFEQDTYQYLSGTDLPVSQVIDNLMFISKLRNAGIINEFEIATVVCERNFREMPDFVKKCLDTFSMDTIRLRFFEPYGVMDVNTEWFYDIRNSYHPYHSEFEKVMNHPILKNKKVWKWQGEKKSLQKESPYILEKRNMYGLSNLMLLDNGEQLIKKYMNRTNIKSIAIWGASYTGKALRKLLNEKYGIEVNTLFDSYIKEERIDEYSIKRASADSVANFDMIIISTETFAVQIRETLERLNYQGKVVVLSELFEQLKCID